jgi:SAM-dependent methyltransferase
LDLGCGTGLELEEIFKINPDINVTGIDLTQAMLDMLSEKYSDKSIMTICASYLDYDFGEGKYDCVISFETMHHWSHETKAQVYKNIYIALKNSGSYIECDYMVEKQSEEDYWFSESDRIRAEQNIMAGEFYHLDTPCTIDNQIKLLLQAGFTQANMVWRKGGTTIIVATK